MTSTLRPSRSRTLPPVVSTFFTVLPAYVAALFPVASMVLVNLSVLRLTDWLTWRPAAFAAAAVTAILLLSRFVSADLGARAAAIATWCVLLELHSTVSSMLPAAWSTQEHPYAAILYLTISTALARAVGRHLGRRENRILLIGGATGLLLLIASLFVPAVRSRIRPAWGDARSRIASTALQAPLVPAAPRSPDVYYFVLDGLVRGDIAKERHGADLTSFQESLRSRGFAIPARARSNYGQTHLSLAGSLNMSYLDDLARVMGDGNDRTPLRDLVAESGVVQRFRASGYEFVMIGSDYSITVDHPLADRCFCRLPVGTSELEIALLGNSIARALVNDTIYDAHRRKVLAAFAAAETLGHRTRPRFVFAHIVAPHPPFVFDADGRRVPQRSFFSFGDGTQFPGTPDEYRRGYAAQVRFVLARLLTAIDRIDADGREAIVLVHGDHGSGLGLDQTDLGRSDARERLSITMAVRTPGEPVPDDLTPVNLFRIVFNRLFGSTFPLLSNQSYMSSWQHPYRFRAVHLES